MERHHVGRMTIVAAAMVVAFVGSAAAQHEGHRTAGTAGSAAPEKVTSCSQNAQAVVATLDAANIRIEAARQSNNAPAMRAAIADLQVALSLMKGQLADCVSLQPGSTAPALGAASAEPPGQIEHSKMAMATPPPSAESQTSRRGAETAAGVDITFRTQPTPLKTGENQFEVTVKGADGKPVTDAEVSVLFVMPAMPAMKMPEMRNEVKLKAAGSGTYTGAGQIMMAGQWNVIISVKRGGKEIGQKKVTAAAVNK